jgi:ATP-dependent exoDNAse (exonuclease V) alpha subunit
MANPGVRTQTIKTGIAVVHFAIGDKVMMTANDKDNSLTNGQVGFVKNIALNGNYKNKGAGQHSQVALESNGNVELADEDFELTLTELASEAGFEEEEEESINQRQASHIVEVDFNGRLVAFSTAGEFRKLAPAYAITCHKSQGGEYPVVVILMHSANGKMLSREWFYTAVTRARERVVLVCNMRGLNMALSNQRIKGKTLAEKTAAYVRFAEEAIRTGAEMPELPEPQKVEG